MSTVPSSVAGLFRHVLFVLILLLPLVVALPAQGQTEGWRLSLGGNQTCLSRPGQPLLCWGQNPLGVRDAQFILTPTPVAGLEGAGPVAASGGHVCAVTPDGGVSCFGMNLQGQLGLGDTNDRAVPTAVPGMTGVSDVDVGGNSSCVLRSGQVWCWGDLNSTPRQLTEVQGATQLSVGSRHACAIAGDGALWCWGGNAQGQLGNGTTSRTPSGPVRVPGLAGVTHVDAGFDHTCAVDRASRLWCWGLNDQGQLGLGDQVNRNTPVQLEDFGAVRQVSGGGRFTCAAMVDGRAFCWGNNQFGKLGTGTGNVATPTPVLDLTDVVQVRAGTDHACALTGGRELFCWGENLHGQLGIGSRGQSSRQSRPAPVRGFGRAETVTTLTGPANAALGDPLRFDIRVTSPAGGTPQGTVSLRAGNAEIHAAQLDGSGNFRLPQFADLPAGVHQLRAHFLGSADFAPSVSAPLTVTVAAPAALQTGTVIQGPTRASANERITYRVRTTPQAAGGPNFNLLLLNGFAISTAPVTAADGWTSFEGNFPPGRHLLQGVYLSRDTFQRRYPHGWSISAPIELVVSGGAEPAATRTRLTGPARAIQGEALRYRAEVTERPGGAAARGGRVHFLLNGEFHRAVDIDAQGVAVLDIPHLPLGRYQVVARYMASPSHQSSGSDDAPIWLEVGFGAGLAPTLTTLAGPSDTTVGAPVTLRASVLAGGPTFQSGAVTGRVSFRQGGEEIAAATLNAQGEAQATVSNLRAGTARITAHYLGSSSHGASSSSVLAITVAQPRLATTTTLSGPTSRPLGEAIRFTARVQGTDGSSPLGRVVFRLNGDPLADVSLLNGVATLTRSNLPEGRHRITAHFQGYGNYDPSDSEVLEVTIGDPPPEGDGFVGGGAVFAATDECGPGFGAAAPHPVTLRYSPSELGELPSGLSVVWRGGSEHLALWGPMAPSAQFFGAAGRGTWTRFVFYPLRPLVRVVQRQITEPAGAADLALAEELVLRLRVQNFGALPGCAVTISGILRRG